MVFAFAGLSTITSFFDMARDTLAAGLVAAEPAGGRIDAPSSARQYSRAVAAIRLERLSHAHLDGLSALVEDPVVRLSTRIPESPPPGFTERWLESYEQGRREGTREAFAIVDAEGGGFLGFAAAVRIEAEAQTAELGYIVAAPARGRGIASEALRELSAWAFSELAALRLELLIGVDNVASKRVAERAGYELEGTLRSIQVKPGVRGDMEIWSRLASDA
jgi:RimJ/RimL family protein N-acetyltransferase